MKAAVFAALLVLLSAFWQQHVQGRNPAGHFSGLLGGGTLSQKQFAVSWICLQSSLFSSAVQTNHIHKQVLSLFPGIKMMAVSERVFRVNDTGSGWLHEVQFSVLRQFSMALNKDQNQCSGTRGIIFILCILLPSQNVVPTLPIMHLNHQQFSWRFGCGKLVLANLASSTKKLVSSLLSNFQTYYCKK